MYKVIYIVLLPYPPNFLHHHCLKPRSFAVTYSIATAWTGKAIINQHILHLYHGYILHHQTLRQCLMEYESLQHFLRILATFLPISSFVCSDTGTSPRYMSKKAPESKTNFYTILIITTTLCRSTVPWEVIDIVLWFRNALNVYAIINWGQGWLTA